MRHLYEDTAIKQFVSAALEDGPRGTMSGLARRLGIPQSTVHKWLQRQTCPNPDFWPDIEDHFGWEPGTLAGLLGAQPGRLDDLESHILQTDELDEAGRDVLLRMYYVLRTHRSGAVVPPPRPVRV